jgi:hypothetical protein
MGTADCRAMDLELEGDQLYMRGPIGTDDWVKHCTFQLSSFMGIA